MDLEAASVRAAKTTGRRKARVRIRAAVAALNSGLDKAEQRGLKPRIRVTRDGRVTVTGL